MEIKEKIFELLIREFIGEENRSELNEQTPLLSSGILDSISTLKLVDDLEKLFNIKFLPHEVDRDNLDDILKISNFIAVKIGSGR